MNTFFRFFYEFISIFFDGLVSIFVATFQGITQMFDFNKYRAVLNGYKDSFKGPEWLFVGLTIAILVIMVLALVLLVFFAVKKLIRFRKTKLNQEDLLHEIADLNKQVKDLITEKNKIMAMKVSQLGVNPSEEEEQKEEEVLGESETRFPKLARIDEEYKKYKVKKYNNTLNLEELIDAFKCFSASQLKLYYDESLLRAFFGALACGKLIILQGISGTGKTSLAYAWGKFVKNDSCVASVQPSWRDKTELLGYFNEFTKKFNETDVLAELYLSSNDDEVHTIILDEMNIARVEYYFAEMLSILEMPIRSEWIIEIVPNSWSNDPINIKKGKLQLPPNLWYIGTINNDDSTFMVTDKVYDRAMPIDINTKVNPFKCREQEAININSTYLESLFEEAINNKQISESTVDKIREMDDYVIKHFRVAFGNRIMKQMNTFVPVYVACGGDELTAVDYFIAKKIFRKFDQLNISVIRDEIDPFISYLNKIYGNNIMKECISYLELLKKSM